MESRNKKNPFPNLMFFSLFIIVVLWNIMQQQIFDRWPRKLRKWPWFGANLTVNACQDLATLEVQQQRPETFCASSGPQSWSMPRSLIAQPRGWLWRLSCRRRLRADSLEVGDGRRHGDFVNHHDDMVLVVLCCLGDRGEDAVLGWSRKWIFDLPCKS